MNQNINDANDFEILEFLGSGTFSTVRKGTFKNEIVAVKLFHPNKDDKVYEKEINELKAVSHENIIKLIAFGKTTYSNEIYNCLIIEYADLGSVHTLLKNQKYKYTLSHAINWLYQCANAIDYLHSQKPKPKIHRDLKTLNLLLMKGGTILKICDFGMATYFRTDLTADRGTPAYIAPEVVTSNYNEKCDVYSYTIIVWEILVRLDPYFHLKDPSSAMIIFGVTSGKLRPKTIANCPKIFQLIFDRGIDKEPKKRPTMKQLFEIMKTLNDLVNKQPIKPLLQNDNLTLNRLDSQLDISNNNEHKTILPESLNKTGGQFPLYQVAKGGFHRRSKSYGNESFVGQEQKQINKYEIKQKLEANLNEPLLPIQDNIESLEIYNKHLDLINEDRELQKDLNALTNQRDQLEQGILIIEKYKELSKQKSLLMSEISKLKNLL